MNKQYISCSCLTPDHELILMFDDRELTIFVQLQQQSFLQRLVAGIKYIFGKRASSGTGHWEETILMPDQQAELAEKLLANISANELSKVGRRKLMQGVRELREQGLPHEEDMKKSND